MSSKVVVVFGGDSPEHEISLCCACGVLNHAKSLGWDVLPIGITKDGQWLAGPGALERLWRVVNPHLLPKGYAPTDRVPGAGGDVQVLDGLPTSSMLAGYELAFPVCQGGLADGTVQAVLSCYGLQVVGCGVAASAVCFDKHLTKSVLSAAGLPVAKGIRVERFEYLKTPELVVAAARKAIGPFPWFVKPVRGGSSIGIGRVDSAAALGQALDEAFRWDTAALVEESVPHRELVIGVMGRNGGKLTVSPPGECVAVGTLYTYEEKYRLGNPRFTCPAEVDGPLLDRARRLAAEAFLVLGCSILARVDLFLDQRTNDFLINEVNHIPGMTETSVFPKVMQAAGYSYPQLLRELCRLAAQT